MDNPLNLSMAPCWHLTPPSDTPRASRFGSKSQPWQMTNAERSPQEADRRYSNDRTSKAAFVRRGSGNSARCGVAGGEPRDLSHNLGVSYPMGYETEVSFPLVLFVRGALPNLHDTVLVR